MERICAHCESTTDGARCEACGRSPLLRQRYALIEAMGEGASGRTHRARDRQADREVAIKELAVHGLQSFKAHELFEREADVLCRLGHDGIPTFYDRFRWGEGKSLRFYLVMEFVDGHSLDEELGRRHYAESDVCDIARELAAITSYLHERSPPVIHRDIKPTNVMRRTDGTLALVDFGSVRAALEPDTGGSTVAGTIGYMAPEQLRGVASPASDVYATGVLMVQMLSRTPPVEMLDADNHLEWRELDVSPGLADLLEEALSSDPDDRPPDGHSLAERIGRIDDESAPDTAGGATDRKRPNGPDPVNEREADPEPPSDEADNSAGESQTVATRVDASANVWEIDVSGSSGRDRPPARSDSGSGPVVPSN